ncbi:hypothetical protein HZA38_00720 [Candidatus Peregrinibacteria bacterium]|nr:hypothetical protein [Candidatus Peregrinibacteria bacterium]
MPSCPECNASFQITQFEKEFYEKIGVPPPKHCPDCRLIHRVIFRNEQKFYKRECDFTKKNTISLYPPSSPVKIYTVETWFSDKWDPMEYGRDFDFSKSFFEQYRELSFAVPKPSLTQLQNENSPYTTGTGYCKNCYLMENSRIISTTPRGDQK